MFTRQVPAGTILVDAQSMAAGKMPPERLTDAGISGTKGRDKRPGYDRLCFGIARREFDQVASWSVDRLGRSLQNLVAFLDELHAKGVDLYLHQQGLDTSTPAGKAMFQMVGVFSEFERAMIKRRLPSMIRLILADLPPARARRPQFGVIAKILQRPRSMPEKSARSGLIG
jgi:Resolvase, N terminal domain